MADDRDLAGDAAGKKHRALAAATLLALAGLLLAVSGLTLFASLVGLAVASPLFLLFSPVLVPAALLALLLPAGAVVSGMLAIGAVSMLSRLATAARKAAAASTRDYVEEGKRRVGEVAAAAVDKTPHAELAVVSKEGHSPTDHKIADNYEHYVAGRMVGSA
ncbi:hypothetical protein ACP70R_032201 [Stipagrostis hirtigluma subsp. patula]